MKTSRYYFMLFGAVSALFFMPVMAEELDLDDSGAPPTTAVTAEATDVKDKLEPRDNSSAVEDRTPVSVEQTVEPGTSVDAGSASPRHALASDRALESASVDEPKGAADAMPHNVETSPKPDAVESAVQSNGGASYRNALNEELRAVEAQTPTTNDPAPSGTARVGRIQSIVSEALEFPDEPVVNVLPQDKKKVEEPQRQQRLQTLQKAVSSATEAADGAGDQYVSTLQREGAKTVVIDEATAKRPAIAPRTPLPRRLTARAAVSTESGETYTVKPGDSLWLIAKRFYGDGHLYRVLFEANKDRIIDKNVLIMGQVLRIPPATVALEF